MNEHLLALCRLNGVCLFVTATPRSIEWQAVQSEDGLSRSGLGESPELAIIDCKAKDFQPVKKQTE